MIYFLHHYELPVIMQQRQVQHILQQLPLAANQPPPPPPHQRLSEQPTETAAPAGAGVQVITVDRGLTVRSLRSHRTDDGIVVMDSAPPHVVHGGPVGGGSIQLFSSVVEALDEVRRRRRAAAPPDNSTVAAAVATDAPVTGAPEPRLSRLSQAYQQLLRVHIYDSEEAAAAPVRPLQIGGGGDVDGGGGDTDPRDAYTRNQEANNYELDADQQRQQRERDAETTRAALAAAAAAAAASPQTGDAGGQPELLNRPAEAEDASAGESRQ